MFVSDNPSAIRSQREITEALLALMSAVPYDEITVKQILLESKLAKKTFYRNYESKEDVLLSLVRTKLRDYFRVVDAGSGDVLTTIFTFAVQNKDLLILLDRNDMLHIVLQCMNEYIGLHKTGSVSETNPFVGLFDGLDSEYLIALNIGAVWNVIALWIHQGMEDDPEHVRETIRQYLKRLSE
ncbi:MAG: TetR/AcrR family transcriptional regulator [Lachnospiraceae bacterium]|nr:TetR/AcrR family transcriptional regulator [Lachnospiraceae bacterium]